MLLEPVGQYRLQPEGQVPNLGGRDHDGRPHIVRGDPSLGDALRAGSPGSPSEAITAA